MRISKLVAGIVIFLSTIAHAGTYKLDESHTNIGFKIKHLVISKVNGRFDKFSGSFKYDSASGKLADLKVTIEASSVDTNEPDRDKHLRSKDFFDVDKFKTLEFIAKDVSYENKKPSEVKGDLIIHGITKPITLALEFKGEVTDSWGNQHLVFEAHARVNRKDFGLNWNKNLDHGGVMIADDVAIIIEGEAILQNQEKKK